MYEWYKDRVTSVIINNICVLYNDLLAYGGSNNYKYWMHFPVHAMIPSNTLICETWLLIYVLYIEFWYCLVHFATYLGIYVTCLWNCSMHLRLSPVFNRAVLYCTCILDGRERYAIPRAFYYLWHRKPRVMFIFYYYQFIISAQIWTKTLIISNFLVSTWPKLSQSGPKIKFMFNK